MMLFGAALFAAALVPPGLGAGRRVRIVARAAVPLVVLATLLRLPLAAATMGDGWADALDPGTLGAVLSGTAAGRAWAVQMAAALVLAAVAAGRGGAASLAGASGLVLVSLALSGHAAAGPGPAGWLAGGSLALHLLTGGAWIGSLPEVLRLMGDLGRGTSVAEAGLALRRFSAAGHGAVALVIATGVSETLLVAGLTPALPASAYGAALAVKAALAAGMVAGATVNRYRLVPRLGHAPGDVAGLLRNTRAVLVLGFGAVAVSGLLGLLDPP